MDPKRTIDLAVLCSAMRVVKRIGTPVYRTASEDILPIRAGGPVLSCGRAALKQRCLLLYVPVI